MGIVVAVTALAAACYLTAWQSPIRLAATLAFMLVAPGLALSAFVQTEDAWQRMVLAIGASLAAETLITVTLVYSGGYTPERAFFSVAILTVSIAVTAVIRERVS
jgi:hypothetical protein